jgi:hypothetical protein
MVVMASDAGDIGNKSNRDCVNWLRGEYDRGNAAWEIDAQDFLALDIPLGAGSAAESVLISGEAPVRPSLHRTCECDGFHIA